MCSDVLVGDLLDVLELEAVVEVLQSWAADQYRWGCQAGGGGGVVSSPPRTKYIISGHW